MQEAQAPLPAGAVIHEHYIVESLLGKGDFGNVYLVRDQRDKQKLFALAEVINPNEQERYRFTFDYVSLAPLDHRTLPQVQYVFNDDKLSRAYVLMSYLEELNLEILRLQQAEKRFPLSQVMALMTPVINAVTHCITDVSLLFIETFSRPTSLYPGRLKRLCWLCLTS